MIDKKKKTYSFLLALDKNYTLEDCQETAKAMMDRLDRFVKNGFSDKGLNFKYKSVKKY